MEGLVARKVAMGGAFSRQRTRSDFYFEEPIGWHETLERRENGQEKGMARPSRGPLQAAILREMMDIRQLLPYRKTPSPREKPQRVN